MTVIVIIVMMSLSFSLLRPRNRPNWRAGPDGPPFGVGVLLRDARLPPQRHAAGKRDDIGDDDGFHVWGDRHEAAVDSQHHILSVDDGLADEGF